MPLTLRLIYHSLRALYIGAIILVVGWLWLIPANQEERRALGAPLGENKPSGLATLRVARVILDYAPERGARMLSLASAGELSPELATLLLTEIAKTGPGTNIPAQNRSGQATQTTGGAKFVTVDRP